MDPEKFPSVNTTLTVFLHFFYRAARIKFQDKNATSHEDCLLF